MSGRTGDLALAVLAMSIAVIYGIAANAVPVSLLSDAVGAGGVPLILAVALGTCGLLLAARALLAARQGEPAEVVEGHGTTLAGHAQAALLVAILAGYVALMPYLGYPAAIALLVGIVAAQAGERRLPMIVVTSAAAGVGFWLVFAKLLGIAVPLGVWLARG